MPRPLENRSLDRGISILEALGEHGACSLHRLHELTGLPKSTLRRLLATLLRRRLVRQGFTDRLFRINVLLPMISGNDLSSVAATVVDVALPHMQALTEDVEWPSDLHLRHGPRMRIVETTRALSPFQVRRVRVDLEVNIFGSAAGRAYLMGLDQDQLDRIIDDVGDDPQFGYTRFGLTPKDIAVEMRAARRAGYASRRRDYFGASANDDKLSAIAVPINDGNGPIGALTLVWTRTYLEPVAFAKCHLAELAKASAAISADLITARAI